MKSNKKWSMLTLIMMFWFTISFITNILGPLIPDIIHNFELKDLAMAGFIPTSFFLAYAIMSIPAGILIDKYGERSAAATRRFPHRGGESSSLQRSRGCHRWRQPRPAVR